MVRQRRELRVAQAGLTGRDPVMDRLVAAHGPCRLPAPAPSARRFADLAESIAYQQLHGSAAASIWARVEATVGGTVSPSALLTAGPDRLASCGLSGAKVRSMLDLAASVEERRVRLDRIGRLGDEEVIAELTQVWGIGRWTAQMFLMFTLGRLDVWPTGDFGVRNGWSIAYGLSELPGPGELEALGDRFVGSRSLVAWYCWRAADTPGGRSG